ncbi:probable calcium-binding protein CML22 [Impatiens glandulifera]|uniref:probable calcium-binding protein CML22 n=1 Tax=Impatiens glandulifera TaxID=253017 RepID=UPI001FB074A5|nr:probable calcium-binding protein CML22 [Impatiens glandulifera]
MKDPSGKHHDHHRCPLFRKSWSDKLRDIFFCFHVSSSQRKCRRLDAKLEKKMIEAHQRKLASNGNNSFKSMNSLILKFPQIRQGLKQVRHLFIEYDEDSNGVIDINELRRCLNKYHLQIHLEEEELDDVFSSCDMNGIKGIQLKEFIAVLCLIYVLKSKLGVAELESTFEIIVEAFLFLDKNGDGKLNKKDVIKSLNEDFRWERSSMHVITNRFKEMDWADRDGNVSFREFLFSLINWVGIIDLHEEEDEDDNEEQTIHVIHVD